MSPPWKDWRWDRTTSTMDNMGSRSLHAWDQWQCWCRPCWCDFSYQLGFDTWPLLLARTRVEPRAGMVWGDLRFCKKDRKAWRGALGLFPVRALRRSSQSGWTRDFEVECIFCVRIALPFCSSDLNIYRYSEVVGFSHFSFFSGTHFSVWSWAIFWSSWGCGEIPSFFLLKHRLWT